MSATVEISYLVGASEVARIYGVTRQQVYRAAKSGRLSARAVRNRSRWILLFDTRDLPPTFPHHKG